MLRNGKMAFQDGARESDRWSAQCVLSCVVNTAAGMQMPVATVPIHPNAAAIDHRVPLWRLNDAVNGLASASQAGTWVLEGGSLTISHWGGRIKPMAPSKKEGLRTNPHPGGAAWGGLRECIMPTQVQTMPSPSEISLPCRRS